MALGKQDSNDYGNESYISSSTELAAAVNAHGCLYHSLSQHPPQCLEYKAENNTAESEVSELISQRTQGGETSQKTWLFRADFLQFAWLSSHVSPSPHVM